MCWVTQNVIASIGYSYIRFDNIERNKKVLWVNCDLAHWYTSHLDQKTEVKERGGTLTLEEVMTDAVFSMWASGTALILS